MKKEEASEMKNYVDAYVRKHELAKSTQEKQRASSFILYRRNERFIKEIADIRGVLKRAKMGKNIRFQTNSKHTMQKKVI